MTRSAGITKLTNIWTVRSYLAQPKFPLWLALHGEFAGWGRSASGAAPAGAGTAAARVERRSYCERESCMLAFVLEVENDSDKVIAVEVVQIFDGRYLGRGERIFLYNIALLSPVLIASLKEGEFAPMAKLPLRKYEKDSTVLQNRCTACR